MIPVWAIPLVVQVASKLIDYAFDSTEKQPAAKKEAVYDKIMKKDVKAYGKMRGNQHV
jgi:hypothetical protein